MILNLAGNNDAHGKNFSLLYRGVGAGLEIRLALLYDVVSTLYYPRTQPEMAMKIGGEYLIREGDRENFEQLADEAGLGKPLVRCPRSEMPTGSSQLLQESPSSIQTPTRSPA